MGWFSMIRCSTGSTLYLIFEDGEEALDEL